MNDQMTKYSAERLRLVFDHQGRRKDWFADQLGKHVSGKPFHYSYASKLLSGEKPITEEIAIAAATILQIPVDWLRDESAVVPEVVEVVAAS